MGAVDAVLIVDVFVAIEIVGIESGGGLPLYEKEGPEELGDELAFGRMVISRTVSVDGLDAEFNIADVAEVVGGGMKADIELLDKLEVDWTDVAEVMGGRDEVVEGLLGELEIDGTSVEEVVIGEEEVD